MELSGYKGHEVGGREDLETTRQLLKEAIEAERFEDAARLRDAIKGMEEGTYADNLVPEGLKEGEMFLPTSDETQEAIEERRRKERAERLKGGRETINESPLAPYLLDQPNVAQSRTLQGGQNHRTFGEEYSTHAPILKDPNHPNYIDALLKVEGDKQELDRIIKTARDKITELWDPYRDKNGIDPERFAEWGSRYTSHSFTGEDMEILNSTPRDLAEALTFWQNTLDNARLMRDVIKKIEEEV